MDIESLVAQMAEKVGISEEQAKGAVEFLMEHKDDAIAAISGGGLDSLKDKLPGGLGGLL